MKEEVMLIGEKTVKKYLTAEDAIRRVEEVWKWYGQGDVVMPSKITLDMEKMGVKGWINSMPSYIRQTDLAGIKWVGGFADNPKNGLPFIKAKILLTDPRTGELKAMISGDWISDLRTGAQPAVMAKYLAAKTGVVTIIGAGTQGYTSLLCMSKILPVDEVRVCDIDPKARENFIARFMPGAPFKMISCDNLEQACRGSDVIITVTTADAPLVQESWVKEGGLVMTMGSFTETSEDLVRKADKLIVDHIGQALHRGNLAKMSARGEISAGSFAAELPSVIAGMAKGRENDRERILAGLIGMGALDAGIAALVYQRVLEAGENMRMVDLAE